MLAGLSETLRRDATIRLIGRPLPSVYGLPNFGSPALIAGDCDGSRCGAQVVGMVVGTHGDRIMAAILIISVSRGRQHYSKSITSANIEHEDEVSSGYG